MIPNNARGYYEDMLIHDKFSGSFDNMMILWKAGRYYDDVDTR